MFSLRCLHRGILASINEELFFLLLLPQVEFLGIRKEDAWSYVQKAQESFKDNSFWSVVSSAAFRDAAQKVAAFIQKQPRVVVLPEDIVESQELLAEGQRIQ